MVRVEYAAWFRDGKAMPDDEDYEWVAVMVIEAETPESAKDWGDHLARSYSNRNPDETFLRSDVEMLSDSQWETGNWQQTPLIRQGYEASDGEIGW
jgi:hypothetical protein